MNLDKTMYEFYDQLEIVLMEKRMEQEIQLMRQHIYEKRRPLDEMISLLKRFGFIAKTIDHDMFKYHFADGTAMFNHYFIRMAFMDSWVKLLPEDRADEIFEIIEMRLNEMAHMAGGIKLSVPFVVINALKKG
jgi:hypothetical protein